MKTFRQVTDLVTFSLLDKDAVRFDTTGMSVRVFPSLNISIWKDHDGDEYRPACWEGDSGDSLLCLILRRDNLVK